MFSYKTYLIFLFVSLGISIGLQMILPFPYGLVAAIGLFIAFPFLLRRQYMNRMRGYGGGSSTGSSNNRHRGGSCPRCGSKMQRADF